MTFANICANREQRSFLSQLLTRAFPGCIIHQSCDSTHAFTRLSAEALDAVFVDADTHGEVTQLLTKQKSTASIYLLCRHNMPPPEKTDGIHSIITYPITKQKIQGALQTIPPKTREVI